MSLNNLQTSLSDMDSSNVYTDLNRLQKLRVSAKKDSNAAIPEVARQFEAVMITMMIKNLRKTGVEDPIFQSQAMDSYRDMYDQQLGMELSKGEGIGFAKAIAEQIKYQSQNRIQKPEGSDNPANSEALIIPQRRHFPDHNPQLQKDPADSTISDPAINKPEKFMGRQLETISQKISAEFNSPEEFVQKLWPLAENAARKLGVSAELILSQAALETGWGKHVISNDANSSFNLFNIKASQNWSGSTMEKVSTEFIPDDRQQSKAVRQKSHFKAYDSFAQSFDDYVELVQNNRRYNAYINNYSKNQNMNKTEQSLHDETYINGIHKAGYATDPGYSNKVLRVLKSDAIQNQLLNQTKIASK